MTKIVFIDYTGHETEVEATDGDAVMETALNNNIDGIVADCGGACACATCHVFVENAFRTLTGEPDDMEDSMLDLATGRTERSRLSCQIEVRSEPDGLRVKTPEVQG